MMILLVIMTVFVLCMVLFAWSLWRFKKVLYKLVTCQQEIHQNNVNINQELYRQVGELKQTMGVVANGLQAMGQQINPLNIITGQDPEETIYEFENAQPGITQIMIEIMPESVQQQDIANDLPEHQAISLDEMPPELQEKIKIFESLYKTIISSEGNLPSYKKPELN